MKSLVTVTLTPHEVTEIVTALAQRVIHLEEEDRPARLVSDLEKRFYRVERGEEWR